MAIFFSSADGIEYLFLSNNEFSFMILLYRDDSDWVENKITENKCKTAETHLHHFSRWSFFTCYDCVQQIFRYKFSEENS